MLALLASSFVTGAPTRLARGTAIAGYDVGGLTHESARSALAARAAALQRRPLEFVAGGRSFRLTASQLGVRADWAAAVREAAESADGVGPLRSWRRLQARLFGVEVSPPVQAYPSVLRAAVDRIAAEVDRPAADAALVRRGLRIAVTPARAGARLDRAAASTAIVAALGTLERTAGAVRLPLVGEQPRVTRAELADAAARARTAVSAPVVLSVGSTRFRLPRWRLAQLLELPRNGETRVAVGGPAADRWLGSLARSVARPPQDAAFRVVSGGIEVVPSRAGRAVDVDEVRRGIERAAFSSTARVATVGVRETQPARTTADARAMGITGVVGSYTTTYGGTPGRVHNVALVAELIDGALVAPGARFSFNETTGERNASKGFQEAPVIINGELQTGIGGGVCQVSTTVFNAAFEAGLSIERRTNHALYIDHYPLGRDATVNYPDLDLVFRNDTEGWLLVRTFVNAGALTVNLYGTPPGRRVETETAPLVVTGKIPVKRVKDATLPRGKRRVEDPGEPPRETSVRRRVFEADGTLLYDSTWGSTYSAEPKVVRIGTKRPPEVVPPGPSSRAGDGVQPAVTTPEPTTRP